MSGHRPGPTGRSVPGGDPTGDAIVASRSWRPGPAGDGARALERLIAAAAHPAHPEELAGEDEARAAFRALYRPAGDTGRLARPHLPPPAPLTAAAKLAAAVAMVLVTGTAYAAESGNLPRPVQRQAHHLFANLGVPAPPTPPATASPDGATPGDGSATPTPEGSGSTNATDLTNLCRLWQAQADVEQGNSDGSPDPRLIDAAGGAGKVRAYCAELLVGPAPSASATASSEGHPTPHPHPSGHPTPHVVPHPPA